MQKTQQEEEEGEEESEGGYAVSQLWLKKESVV